MSMCFYEWVCRRSTLEMLEGLGFSSADENLVFDESLVLMDESVLDSIKDVASRAGHAVKGAIDIPEKITDGIYKAYKVMKSVAFLAALVYMGFRFEAIRALFPWLAPVIDQMGSAVLSAGGEFLKASFGWLKKIAGDVVVWLVDQVSPGEVYKGNIDVLGARRAFHDFQGSGAKW